MSKLCKECDAETAWDDDAGSAICTQCGTLSDPSQTLLTHQTFLSSASETAHLWDVPGHPTLKSTGNNWDLAGQGKEVHNRRNHLAMTQFINSLCVSINAPGLSPRATTIFNQAITTGKFRWGRKAKLVAGASLAIALREYRRPDSLNDIAYLLSEQYPTLVRTLNTIVLLLDISLTPVDPSVHIPSLFSYLSSLLTSDPSQAQPTTQLSAPLLSQLKLVSLRAASNTAIALSTCLARLGPDHTINSLPSPPTAVALFLLAIEAESRAPLKHLGELAECLGARCHRTSRGVVMARYKLIQDEIAAWVDQVPWLGKYERCTSKTGRERAKISKRSVVARGVADVLQFQEEIWRKKLKPIFTLDATDDDDDADGALSCTLPELATRPSKRQKLIHRPLRDATHFLLNPLSSPLPKYEYHTGHTGPITAPWVQQRVDPLQNESLDDTPCQNGMYLATRRQSTHTLPIRSMPYTMVSSLPAYILTTSKIDTLLASGPPTRLQLLTAARGTEEEIDDDELFDEGELERLLRTPEEAEEMNTKLVGLGIWEEDNNDEDDEVTPAVKRKHRERRSRPKDKDDAECLEDGKANQRKSRVDLDALARFLESPASNEDAENDEDEVAYGTAMLGLEPFYDTGEFGPSFDVNETEERDTRMPCRPGLTSAVNLNLLKTPPRTNRVVSTLQNEGEVVVGAWRPLSPE